MKIFSKFSILCFILFRSFCSFVFRIAFFFIWFTHLCIVIFSFSNANIIVISNWLLLIFIFNIFQLLFGLGFWFDPYRKWRKKSQNGRINTISMHTINKWFSVHSGASCQIFESNRKNDEIKWRKCQCLHGSTKVAKKNQNWAIEMNLKAHRSTIHNPHTYVYESQQCFECKRNLLCTRKLEKYEKLLFWAANSFWVLFPRFVFFCKTGMVKGDTERETQIELLLPHSYY